VELKQLLAGLADAGHLCFRYRLLGELWSNSFFHVVSLDDKNAVLRNELNSQYKIIDYSSIMQFEIDGRYHSFQPNFHYDVVPSPELA
jgi:hypothetical protein